MNSKGKKSKNNKKKTASIKNIIDLDQDVKDEKEEDERETALNIYTPVITNSIDFFEINSKNESIVHQADSEKLASPETLDETEELNTIHQDILQEDEITETTLYKTAYQITEQIIDELYESCFDLKEEFNSLEHQLPDNLTGKDDKQSKEYSELNQEQNETIEHEVPIEDVKKQSPIIDIKVIDLDNHNKLRNSNESTKLLNKSFENLENDYVIPNYDSLDAMESDDSGNAFKPKRSMLNFYKVINNLLFIIFKIKKSYSCNEIN